MRQQISIVALTPSMDAPTFYGMFYADGEPKRVALAFSLWSRMAAYDTRIQASATPEGSLWLLVGRGPAGQRAVLVANTEEKPVLYAIAGVEPSRLNVLQVSDASSAVVDMSAEDGVGEIGGHAAQLVTIRP